MDLFEELEGLGAVSPEEKALREKITAAMKRRGKITSVRYVAKAGDRCAERGRDLGRARDAEEARSLALEMGISGILDVREGRDGWDVEVTAPPWMLELWGAVGDGDY